MPDRRTRNDSKQWQAQELEDLGKKKKKKGWKEKFKSPIQGKNKLSGRKEVINENDQRF